MPWTTTPVAPRESGRVGWPLERYAPPRPGGGWQVVHQLSGEEEGVGEDTAALLAHLVATDTGVGEDRLALLVHLTVTDSGVGQDAAALLAHLTGSDHGAGQDTASWLEHLDRAAVDAGVGQDTAALLAHLLATDSAVCQDTAALVAHLLATDSGVGQDTARPAYMNPYSGSKSATTVPHNSWTDLLTFTAAGNGTATVTFSVVHSWGSHFLHFASEQRGVRVLVDGAQVAIQTQNYTTAAWSSTLTQTGVTVPAGASVQIQGMAVGSVYSEPRTVTISSASMTVTGVA